MSDTPEEQTPSASTPELPPADQSNIEVDALITRLEPFFRLNPGSKLGSKGTQRFIERPWDDPSFIIHIPDNPDRLVDALNKVRLPVIMSAIWHQDSKDLEFIFAPLPNHYPLRSRSFDFGLFGNTYHCEYGDSSDTLLIIAEHFQPYGIKSETLYRHLDSFNQYVTFKKLVPNHPFVTSSAPTSFWIRNIEWNQNDVSELARHLNFYMFYFDRISPLIDLHEEQPSQAPTLTTIQFPFDNFPSSFNGRQLNAYLLGIWNTAVRSDAFQRYLYSYQILEYVAFYYLPPEVLRTIKNILVRPDASSRIDDAAQQILDALVGPKEKEDEAKMIAAVTQLVDPDVLWKEIESNIEVFASDTSFEGGFDLPHIVEKTWKLKDFEGVWRHGDVVRTMRKLRNALVHSRESRSGMGIAPTHANYVKLWPWASLISSAAMQVLHRWQT